MKVRVWNKNFLPYTERFEDDTIKIPANGFIMMDEDKAVKLIRKMGSYKVDAGGTQLPETYKKLVIDTAGITPEMAKPEKPKFTCHGCGQIFDDEKVLGKHIDKQHSQQFADPDMIEKRERNAS